MTLTVSSVTALVGGSLEECVAPTMEIYENYLRFHSTGV
jgi:hypothetical protein